MLEGFFLWAFLLEAAPRPCVDPCSPFQGSMFPGLSSGSRVPPTSGLEASELWLLHGTNPTAAAASLVIKLFSSLPATRGTALLTRTLGRATWFPGLTKVYLESASGRSGGSWFPLTWATVRKEEVSSACLLGSTEQTDCCFHNAWSRAFESRSTEAKVQPQTWVLRYNSSF